MLVELIDDDNNRIWLNPAHVSTVTGSAMDSGKALVTTAEGDFWILGTPAEVAAKLNGAEAAK